MHEVAHQPLTTETIRRGPHQILDNKYFSNRNDNLQEHELGRNVECFQTDTSHSVFFLMGNMCTDSASHVG